MEHSFTCTWCMVRDPYRVSLHCTRFVFPFFFSSLFCIGCSVFFFCFIWLLHIFRSLRSVSSQFFWFRIGYVSARCLVVWAATKIWRQNTTRTTLILHGIFTSAFGTQCHSVLSSFVAFFRLDLRFLVPWFFFVVFFFFSQGVYLFLHAFFSSFDFYFVLLCLTFIFLLLLLFLCFALLRL